MSPNNSELIIAKLKRVIQENLARLNADSVIVGEPEILNLLNSLGDFLEQEQSAKENSLPAIDTFIHRLPLAIAILDREMNYSSVSDRWTSDYELEGIELIGCNYYDIFPELPTSWRQSFKMCLAGETEVLGQEEEFSIRQNGTVDWLRWQVRPWHHYDGEIGGLTICSEAITEKNFYSKRFSLPKDKCELYLQG